MNVYDNNIAFLFDLDGVIIDSEREYTEIWHKINLAYPTGVDNFEVAIKGCTLDNILASYFNPQDIADVRDMLHRLESEMRYDYCPGSDRFLADTATRGIPAALVTSSDKVKMAHLYEQHPELADAFRFTVTADLISHSKPHPEGYLLAASRLGVAPEKCVVFEDSFQGICAGKAAGAFVVGIKGTIPVEKIRDKADLCVGSLAEIDMPHLINIVTERQP